MISVRVCRSKDGITGVDADNHGDEIVCAAVSMLVINTVNSIELLTDAEFSCDFAENGGYLSFSIKGAPGHDAGLLLESMYLGLESIAAEYPKELTVREIFMDK